MREIHPFIEPLYVPEDWLVRAESGETGILFYMPIIGHYLRRRQKQSLIRPIVKSVNSQLLDRPEFQLRAPPDVTTVYRWLSRLIRKRIGWACDRFVPADPLRILLWAHHDGLDAEEFCLDLEDRLDITVGGADSLIATFRTLNNLLEHMLANCDDRRLDTMRRELKVTPESVRDFRRD
jgi:hypothetical protein